MKQEMLEVEIRPGYPQPGVVWAGAAMAIFSLNHKFVGRSKHPPGSASLFARYITRNDACIALTGQRMPWDKRELMDWLNDQEKNDRKNARVIDKVIVALPKEFDLEQNLELLQSFGERMTEGRASWMAAIHENDGNPHAHMIFRDRDFEAGKRVMMTSEPGSTERFREGWEQETNRALERHGFEQRVDRRSLEAQGIDREPQIHVGPGAQYLHEHQHEFRSVAREVTRVIDGPPEIVTINYPVIDQGKSRYEENEERKQRNRARGWTPHGFEPPDPHADSGFPVDYMGPENLPDGMPNWSPFENRANPADARLALAWHMISAFGGETAPAADQDGLFAIALEHSAEFHRYQPHERHEPQPFESRPDPDAGKEKAPRDASDFFAGIGLGAIGRIADSLETLFESKPKPLNERDITMADKEQAQKTVDQQQRQAETDREVWRREMLQHYLEQRARERGMERGR